MTWVIFTWELFMLCILKLRLPARGLPLFRRKFQGDGSRLPGFLWRRWSWQWSNYHQSGTLRCVCFVGWCWRSVPHYKIECLHTRVGFIQVWWGWSCGFMYLLRQSWQILFLKVWTGEYTCISKIQIILIRYMSASYIYYDSNTDLKFPLSLIILVCKCLFCEYPLSVNKQMPNKRT